MAQAWRLRHRVFKEQLGWNVPSIDLLEIDPLDKHAVHLCALEGEKVVAYLRALCTTGPYLLERYFPDLIGAGGPPRAPDVWEISRFVADPDHPDRHPIARRLVQAGMAFGHEVGASRLLAVTEPPFERFLRQCGVPIARIAGPRVVGTSTAGDVRAVVVSTDIDQRALASVGLQIAA
jgi:acyl homoserine lactone synthase